MTVNITCRDCDGRRLCANCRSAAARLTEAGYHVEHSPRYAALRAASSGAYGFDACIVPVGAEERSVADAAVSLFAGKRLALVVDGGAAPPPDAPWVRVIEAARYASGDFPLDWLRAQTIAVDEPGGAPPSSSHLEREMARDVLPDDRRHATRRLKRVADAARAVLATADLPEMPRLDAVAVLEDEIAWARAGGTTFSIVLLHLPGLVSASGREDPERREQRLAAAHKAVAGAIRATDVIAGTGDDVLVVLPDAEEAGVALAATRIAAALAAARLRPKHVARARAGRGAVAWSLGHATFPADGATRDTMLARATASLKQM